MLTIAVPKGALYEESAARLRSAGIDVPEDVGRKLAVVTSDGTQLVFLRPTDVPAYVEFGAADCGIVAKTFYGKRIVAFRSCRISASAIAVYALPRVASIAITKARRIPRSCASRRSFSVLPKRTSPSATFRSS